ncbi:hypothetical protein [Achromobacter aloeverae]|uniref:Uncharacterized protein n=1 Tax=Achromobacter aloeverae TaxID=1750518 RepID=A0A4Q1HD40_9BURK|nr:hypothetical protein [Achromobacter aloeverae]RXN83718.1 hypothetical protein C7R54_25930 [Achromobacter aloeverae]
MSDPHTPYRVLRDTDRRIAESLYRLERQHCYLHHLLQQERDAQEAATQLRMLETELRSLRNERDALLRELCPPPLSSARIH